MSDVLRTAPDGGADGEPPVNPYSLVEAVNASADNAHMAWLIFLGVMTYFMIAVAGVDHKDLLLQTPVALPVLQVSIQQGQFFQFAPVVLVLMHLGLISQLVLLARKTIEFDAAVRSLEATDRRTHPLRLELHNFFFVQAVAGPHRSMIMSAFLHTMSWLSVVILPVILLLYIQITYLPNHDITITWTHRIALLVDIALLLLIGIFLLRAETSFADALHKTTRHHPGSFVMTVLVLGCAAFVSFLVATIPGERLDLISRAARPTGQEPSARNPGQAMIQLAGFNIPFLGGRADGSLLGMFHRNLIVTDIEIGQEKGKAKEEAGLNLRGRDLRYARLDRSTLVRADLTGTDLAGASLAGADLREARFQCADVGSLLLTESRETAVCPSARHANLKGARLAGAQLAGLDLRDANLDEAQLDGADLSAALLSGASFAGAHLEKANLSSAQAIGANFIVASLQGADMTGSKLAAADLTSASLQGAVLAFAGLEGAVLRDADLEAADLGAARLFGADLSGARLRAADLRAARIWATTPPAAEALQLADLGELVLRSGDAVDLAALARDMERLDDAALRARVTAALAGVSNVAEQGRWSGSAELKRWQGYAEGARPAAGEPYRGQLTEHLVRLMCRTRWSSGSIASGIAVRAQGRQFRGDMLAIHDRLRSKECPAGEGVPRRVMQRLAAAADAARDR